jgi:hypothetical protein
MPEPELILSIPKIEFTELPVSAILLHQGFVMRFAIKVSFNGPSPRAFAIDFGHRSQALVIGDLNQSFGEP